MSSEWERAARGTEGRRFPWGDESPKASVLNYDMQVSHLTPVGIYPLGASSEGVLDLAGNAWEWTRSVTGDYPYEPGHTQEHPEGDDSVDRVLRGGSFPLTGGFVRAASRGCYGPGSRNGRFGFRVVVSPFFSEL